MGVVSIVLVGNLIIVFFCVLLVGIIIVDILAMSYFTEPNLEAASVMIIAIPRGMSVDYVAHIARSFLEQVGIREEQVIKALESVCPAVFHAGLSTFTDL